MRLFRRLGQKGKALDKALFDAIEQRDEAAVIAALAAGADSNARAELLGDQDVTPLMMAAWECVPAIASRLLQAGAEIDADNAGGTALHRAAWRGDLKMIGLLVTNGASLQSKDKIGQRPRDYALRAFGDFTPNPALSLLVWLEGSGLKPEQYPFYPDRSSR